MDNKLVNLGTFKDFSDGTIKSVFKNERGIIESTLILNKKSRNTDVFCVPTHHYCNLGCKMCHLTKERSNKPMIRIVADDLIEAVIRTSRDKNNERRSSNKNGWLSFMGVGEPLLNMELVQDVFEGEETIKKSCEYDYITYALSTMMPNRNLEKLGDYVLKKSLPLKIHFSMHSPFSEERFSLLPSTKVGVKDALNLLVDYRNKIMSNENILRNFYKFHSTIDPIEIHYTLIKDFNDSDNHLKEVIDLLSEYEIPFKILTFNPIGNMERSSREKYWINELKKSLPNLKIKLYNPPGHQVGSSCGEFTKHYYLSELETDIEKKEFLAWKTRHQIE